MNSNERFEGSVERAVRRLSLIGATARSHGRLYYGRRFTTLKDRTKEIGPGLLKAMLDQLGLTRSDLEQ